ncbi:MAG: class I SAM-dependent methyltransferase [Anaerolineales bacterium]|nr:class I SAM-dependent methyltransferase [Anaerolineales bacterium]
MKSNHTPDNAVVETFNNDLIRAHFNRVAAQWDCLQNETLLKRKIVALLKDAGVGAGETILDAGCGTGLSTGALLSMLSPGGRVFALDLSPQMLRAAIAKYSDPRCVYVEGEMQNLPMANGSVDRCLAYSSWPHFEHPARIGEELQRVLKDGGKFHIWHHDSRERVNRIHHHIGGVIAAHIFPSSSALIDSMQTFPFRLVEIVDTATEIRITFEKHAP